MWFPVPVTGCSDGDVRLVRFHRNHTIIVSQAAQNYSEICESTVNGSEILDMVCREEWSMLIEGRVEICKDNAFSTVCDDRWDLLEARVVCRQLHFISDGKHYSCHFMLSMMHNDRVR